MSSSGVLCEFPSLQLSLRCPLNITLNLPVIYLISEGFKKIGRLRGDFWDFFKKTSKALFLLQVETVFVCLNECVKIMCDFFLFSFVWKPLLL